MLLELFRHRPLGVTRQIGASNSGYHHYFGGSLERRAVEIANSDQLFHLLYLLDTNDPLIPISLPNVRYLPLLFDFRFENNLLYQVVGEGRVEIIGKEEEIIWEFPIEDYPEYFPEKEVFFEEATFSLNEAQHALAYQGVFGIEHLSQSERKKAIAIVESTRRSDRLSGGEAQTADEILYHGFAPFVQGHPYGRCDNPGCTAEVDYISEEIQVELSAKLQDELGQEFVTVESMVYRVPSLDIFAIGRLEAGDDMIYDNPFLTLIFSKCRACDCITASHEL
ncbi:MAG: hypothetical protein JNK90_11995 [Planctomycetaceae bacterium]|nr:hypothetical protein [Planctomycetaceae bacterium]